MDRSAPCEGADEGSTPSGGTMKARCARCKKLMLSPSHQQRFRLRHDLKVYCSDQCRLEARKTGRFLHCHTCQKQIWKAPSQEKGNKSFCSRNCSAVATNKKRRGPLHPNYKHGRGIKYRAEALQHYGAACEVCGYSVNSRLIEVHHIDGDHSNWQMPNLMPMCVWHHVAITRRLAHLVKRKFIWIEKAGLPA